MMELSPIILQILWNRLVAAVDEAAATLVRTSFSTGVREGNDFACVLLDARGDSVVQSSRSIPSFIGTVSRTVKEFLKTYPEDALRPGDVLVTNDPWLGSGHLPDITMAKPIFHRDRLIGFSANVAHSPDIGGRIRGPDSVEIFEEGLRIPIFHFAHGGRLNDALVRLIGANVRIPHEVIGDLMAQWAAVKIAERRLLAVLADYQLDTFAPLADEVQARTEREMRRAIAEVPAGRYESQAITAGVGDPLQIICAVTIKEDEVVVDYAGTSPQVDYAVNVVPNYVYAYTAFALKCLLAPHVPNNEGAYRPVSVFAPEGSVLNPRYPAAVGGRSLVGHLLPCTVFMALAPVLPKLVRAESGSMASLRIVGTRASSRRPFSVYIPLNGGQGASAVQDGASCFAFPSNIANIGVETIESGGPVKVGRKSILTDSGGAGKHQGGCGQEIRIEVLDGEQLQCSIQFDRTEFPARGLFGATSGTPGAFSLNGTPADPKVRRRLKPGDVICLRLPGGGGFGNPREREKALVEADLESGRISEAFATTHYRLERPRQKSS